MKEAPQTNHQDQSINCVEMKHRIQDELRSKWGNTPWSERNRQIRAAAAQDPTLSRHARKGDDHRAVHDDSK